MFNAFRDRWKPKEETRNRIEYVLNHVIEYATKDASGELEKARSYYLAKVGKTFEDDADFEQRMNTFLEWFIFGYQPENGRQGDIYLKIFAGKISSEEPLDSDIKKAIERHSHSVFHIKECRERVIKVKDLIYRKTYYVTSDDTLERGDLLESRVIALGDGSFFSSTHCLHPKTAYPYIKKAIKK